jgi:leucyl aminopeptidase
VTFDSGGLSIKPTDGMKTMKCDMAGAATVLGAMQAIARLKVPVNVVGLCGLVENMLSGNSYKLGDVLRARSGKTIEVLNTDAEGRLVLPTCSVASTALRGSLIWPLPDASSPVWTWPA